MMGDSRLNGSNGGESHELSKSQKTDSYITAIRGAQDSRNKPSFVPLLKPDTTNDLPMKEHGISLPSSPLLDDPDLLKKKPDENIGYTIAELENFRNDPFWRTMRWILFIVFWLLWIGMFLAAILIVLFSPGCTPTSSLSWWRNGVVYQVWVPSFQDSNGDGSGDFVGLINRLKNLRRLGVQAVWVTPFLLSDNFDGAIRDHLAVDSKLGSNSDVEALVEAVHDKGMKMLISVPVGTTSMEHDWFYRSARASLPENANFSSHYHWRSSAEQSPFVSEYSNSSIFYYHHEGQPNWPLLNWQNAVVREEMFDVFSHWIDKGIDGFHLDGIEYLARSLGGSQPSWPDIKDVLRDIRDHVNTHAEKSPTSKDKHIILFTSRENAVEEDKKVILSSGLDSVINYELGSIALNNRICHHSEDTIAGCIHEIISDVSLFHSANNLSAMWEFGNPYLSRIASRTKSRQQAELLTMVQLLLPGTNNIYYGEDIGMMDLPNNQSIFPQRGAMQWDDTKNAGFSTSDSLTVGVHPDYVDNNWAKQYRTPRSHLKILQTLTRLRRNDETLGFGQTLIGSLMDGGFIIVRYRENANIAVGHVYLCATNFGHSPVKLSLLQSKVDYSQSLGRATVVAASSNAEQYQMQKVLDLNDGTITLGPEQGVVLRL